MSFTAEFIPDESHGTLGCLLRLALVLRQSDGEWVFLLLGSEPNSDARAQCFVLHKSKYSTIGRSNTMFSHVSGSNAIVRAKPTNNFASVLQSTFAIRCYRIHLPQVPLQWCCRALAHDRISESLSLVAVVVYKAHVVTLVRWCCRAHADSDVGKANFWLLSKLVRSRCCVCLHAWVRCQ